MFWSKLFEIQSMAVVLKFLGNARTMSTCDCWCWYRTLFCSGWEPAYFPSPNQQTSPVLPKILPCNRAFNAGDDNFINICRKHLVSTSKLSRQSQESSKQNTPSWDWSCRRGSWEELSVRSLAPVENITRVTQSSAPSTFRLELSTTTALSSHRRFVALSAEEMQKCRIILSRPGLNWTCQLLAQQGWNLHATGLFSSGRLLLKLIN